MELLFEHQWTKADNVYSNPPHIYSFRDLFIFKIYISTYIKIVVVIIKLHLLSAFDFYYLYLPVTSVLASNLLRKSYTGDSFI